MTAIRREELRCQFFFSVNAVAPYALHGAAARFGIEALRQASTPLQKCKQGDLCLLPETEQKPVQASVSAAGFREKSLSRFLPEASAKLFYPKLLRSFQQGKIFSRFLVKK